MVAATQQIISFLELNQKEQFTVAAGFKTWSRKLKQSGRKIETKEDISQLSNENKLIIISNPCRKLTVNQYEELKCLMENGVSILILLNEEGEKGSKSNINYFLEEFGISVNSDNVIRTSFVHRYYHPKEALIHPAGVTSAEFCPPCSFVYPFGASLNVQSPALPLLISSNVSFPVNRPLAALYSPENKKNGKLAVFGSTQIFSDKYISKEGNQLIADSIVDLLTGMKTIQRLDMLDVEVPEYSSIPDTIALSDRLKSTLQEGENDVGHDDIQSMFYDSNLYKLDNILFSQISDVYQKLHIPINQLSLIKPNFETPLPPLKPATFPPGFREPSGPSIELFDLDEALSSQRVRLAQITNRCRPDEIDDLEYMLTMSGEALGINKHLNNKQPINILRHIWNSCRDYKMESQD
jgi:intraflagellar transport protein 52